MDEDQRGYAVTLGLTSNPNDVHQDKAFTLLEYTIFYVKPYSSHIPEGQSVRISEDRKDF